MEMRYIRQVSEDQINELQNMMRSEKGFIAQRAHAILLSYDGFKVSELARIFGVDIRSIYNWMNRFESQGPSGLLDKPRSGRPPKASAAIVHEIHNAVTKSPTAFEYLFTVWTVVSLCAHIAVNYAVNLSESTMRRILHSLDLAWKRPKLVISKIDKAAKEKIEQIIKVLSCTKPGNHILFMDESDVHLLPVLRASWSKRGKQSKVSTPGNNVKKSLFGALNYRTGQWFYCIFDRKRAGEFIAFLGELLQAYPTGKIHLIVDNYCIHKAKIVQEWLANNPRIELLYLPSYCPKMNPVEKIWWDLKAKVLANHLYRSINDLLQAIDTYFHSKSQDELLELAA